MYVTKEEILDATNGGLDIILSYYPQAGESTQNRNRKFKVRDRDKTASASLKQIEGGIWLVTDFGGDQKPRNGILVCMLEENCDFKTAIDICAARFNIISNATMPELFKPDFLRRPALETEENGKYSFEYKDDFTDFEIETVFAAQVIEHARNVYKDNWKDYLKKVFVALGWSALVSYTYIKDNEAFVTSSTDKYPIFAIRGDTFIKVYQPKAKKEYRFKYSGTKPKDYIFGYARFCKKFEEENNKFIADSIENEDEEEPRKKKSKAFKLDEVIKCSGDSDAANIYALGYNVIWTNSETAKLPWNVWLSLVSKAKSVYNLPDIDSTGLREAHKLALQYMDLKTIMLPMSLLELKDSRGFQCKDVRDFLKSHGQKDFKNLVDNALEYRFWDEEAFYNKQGEFKKMQYVFNNVRAYNFLMRSGFYRFESKAAKGGYEYIKITDNVVEIIDAKKIKTFVNEFLKERFTADQTLRNTFYRSPQLKDESLDNLEFINLDFKYFGKDFQYMFFKNKTWKVTKNTIEEFKPEEVTKMVWNTKVVQHRVKMLEAPFKVVQTINPDGTPNLDIEINNYDCLFFRYLVNTSRIHWRKELEENCDLKFPNKIEADKYREANRFIIDGELLTAEEKVEQKRHLINKIFTLGYILFRYKNPSKAWAPFIMDHKLSAQGESHGGSGKTIFARAPETFMTTLVLDGKSKSLTEDKHAFENVTEQTEVILIDDMSQWLPIEPFFAKITGDLTVNPKYNQRFVIGYTDSPKILFTSNFGVKDVGPSSERRSLYVSCADYFHNNLTGDYREERTPFHDFGKNLFTDFNETEWNLFINTMAYCLQTFMQIDYKVNPPMDNVSKRNLLGIMGDAFMGWADVYFSHENGKLDSFVPRNEAFQDFVRVTNSKLWSAQKFMSCVAAWCRYYKYELDPVAYHNSKGRIIRKAPRKNHDGSIVTRIENGKTIVDKHATEMVYIKTVAGSVDPATINEADQDTDRFGPAILDGKQIVIQTSDNDNDDIPF